MKPSSFLTRWNLILITCGFILAGALLLSQAQGQSQKDCLNLTEVKKALGVLTITSEDLNAARNALLDSAESQEIWKEKNESLRAGYRLGGMGVWSEIFSRSKSWADSNVS